ncbi:hypothetical protein [Pseudomonas chlororaphis]|uniref:Uncharacterized protein n=1 Tax=Pseudomonas chlororaphis subsp. aurantiaca TaxID=86192 RepID=A0AAJ1E2T4_9PSED|nr:hypothetical protein [Pseudomonas chlororaphis]MBU4633473.1 hypothetical protein [Pseudomonas chlororaphis subsp. aurantiaca]
MQTSLNILQLPFPLTWKPFHPESFSRLEWVQKQFTVVCSGTSKLLDDQPMFGSFVVEDDYVVGYFDFLEEAVHFCTQKRDELDVHPSLSKGSSFHPTDIKIFSNCSNDYKHGCSASGARGLELVLMGAVGSDHIKWTSSTVKLY